MYNDAHAPPLIGVAVDSALSLARPALNLLARSRALLAVTLHVGDMGAHFAITISKPVDEAGIVFGQYWWDVDRFMGEGQGYRCREKRWAVGLRPTDTAEAAYLGALRSVARGARWPVVDR